MKKIICCIATAVCLLAGATGADAQRYKSSDDNSSVIVFHKNGNDKRKNHKKSGEDNIIKIEPIGFLYGRFPLCYERRINDFFSVELQGGITGHNYLRQVFAQEQNPDMIYTWNDGQQHDDQSMHFYDFKYRSASLGYTFGITPRFYLDEEGMDGMFLCFSAVFSRYNMNMQGATGGSIYSDEDLIYGGPAHSEHENVRDLMFGYGKQILYDNLSLEMFSQIGIRTVTGSKYTAEEQVDVNYNPIGIVDGNATYKQTLFNYNFGLRLGYHF